MNQMRTKKKQYAQTVLPAPLVEELSALGLTNTQYKRCLYILSKLSTESYNKNYQDLTCFKPLPKAYLVAMLGEQYYKYMQFLVENQIIESTGHYYKGQCKEFRIHPRFYGYTKPVKARFDYWREDDDTVQQQDELVNFLEVYRRLDIPFDALYEEVKRRVAALTLDDLTTGEDVPMGSSEFLWDIREDWSEVKGERKVTKKTALKTALNASKVLIRHGSNLCMIDPDQYLEMKRKYTRDCMAASIENIRNERTLYARRNDTNDRLNTNFTNMYGELVEIIMKHNGMSQLDVMNCQPALLSNKLESEGVEGQDVDVFHELTRETGYYEYWQLYGLTRDQAKKMTFEVLFGKQFGSKMAQEFKRQFPTVAQYIEDYKKKYGYNAFSISLQKLEARIFIDGIYYELNRQGISCFTKHDSAVFFAEDEQVVRQIIENKFKENNFIAKLRR